MSHAEHQRLLVLKALEAGIVISAEGTELLGLSVRQVRRLRAAYRPGSGGPAPRQPRVAAGPRHGSSGGRARHRHLRRLQSPAPHRDARRAPRHRSFPPHRVPHPVDRRCRQRSPRAASPAPATVGSLYMRATGRSCTSRSTVQVTPKSRQGPGPKWSGDETRTRDIQLGRNVHRVEFRLGDAPLQSALLQILLSGRM